MLLHSIHYVGSGPVDMVLHSDTLCWFWGCRHIAALGYIMLVLGLYTCCSTRIHYVGSGLVDMLLHSDTLCWF